MPDRRMPTEFLHAGGTLFNNNNAHALAGGCDSPDGESGRDQGLGQDQSGLSFGREQMSGEHLQFSRRRSDDPNHAAKMRTVIRAHYTCARSFIRSSRVSRHSAEH